MKLTFWLENDPLLSRGMVMLVVAIIAVLVIAFVVMKARTPKAVACAAAVENCR